MTDDQLALLRDKVEVWTRDSERGPLDLRDYTRRSAEALAMLLRRYSELQGEVSTLRLQQDTDRQTIASLTGARPLRPQPSPLDEQ